MHWLIHALLAFRFCQCHLPLQIGLTAAFVWIAGEIAFDGGAGVFLAAGLLIWAGAAISNEQPDRWQPVLFTTGRKWRA